VTSAVRVSLDVSAIPADPAGAGRYVIELAAALARRSDVDLLAIARRDDIARWRDAGDMSGDALERIEVQGVAPGPRPLRLVWEQLRLPGIVASAGSSVHHSPHYTMPERCRTPVVVTVHDCTFFDHPEWHERSKVMVFRRAIRVACRRAASVICVSETTARRLRELCDVTVPIAVAPHGVDHRRFRPDEPGPGSDDATLGELGLDRAGPLVVFVGTLEPRKGVAGLVAAFDHVAERHRDARLVLAGGPGWGPDLVGRAIAAAANGDRIVKTGYVPDHAVPALFRRAAVVAYPTLEEGFGLPALEALACGAPLVTTSGTAMEEMARGAGTFVPPADVRSLADALDAALSGSGGADRDRLRAAGLRVAASHTWDASAAVHVAAYRRAAEVGAPIRGSRLRSVRR
jgi:glycosyltransferase involved in cell wall biosynthesis